jgi:hypothetical protein
MRNRDGEAPGRRGRERSLLEAREDRLDPGTLGDVVPVPPDQTAGDRKSEQDRDRHAEALANPLEARLPAGQPVNRLFKRTLLFLLGHIFRPGKHLLCDAVAVIASGFLYFLFALHYTIYSLTITVIGPSPDQH